MTKYVLIALLLGLPLFAQQQVTFTGMLPTSSAAQTAPALLTPADWLGFNSKQNALGFTPENASKKGVANGYAALDATGLVPGNEIVWGHISNVPTATARSKGVLNATDWLTFNGKQNALGFTPENAANRGVANGYAALDATGLIPVTELPASAVAPVQVFNEWYQIPTAQTVPVLAFPLANSNVIAATVVAYRNRCRMIPTIDFSVSGNIVTFVPHQTPNPDDIVLFDYQHN